MLLEALLTPPNPLIATNTTLTPFHVHFSRFGINRQEEFIGEKKKKEIAAMSKKRGVPVRHAIL